MQQKTKVNFVLYLAFLTLFLVDSSVTDESFVDETRVNTKFIPGIYDESIYIHRKGQLDNDCNIPDFVQDILKKSGLNLV